MIAFGSHLSIS